MFVFYAAEIAVWSLVNVSRFSLCVQAYDCPVNRHVFAYAALTSGASFRAAECLLKGQGRVAVNWCGGWHHAKRWHFLLQ